MDKICEISRITSGSTRDNFLYGFLLQPNLIFGRAIRLLGKKEKKKKSRGKGQKERREKKPFPLGSQMPTEDNTLVSRLKGLYHIQIGGSFSGWVFLNLFGFKCGFALTQSKNYYELCGQIALRAKLCLLVSKQAVIISI